MGAPLSASGRLSVRLAALQRLQVRPQHPHQQRLAVLAHAQFAEPRDFIALGLASGKKYALVTMRTPLSRTR